jgi:hypothetical protein
MIPLPNDKSLLPPHPDLAACYAGMPTTDEAMTSQAFKDILDHLGKSASLTVGDDKLVLTASKSRQPPIVVDSCPPELFNEDGSPRVVDYMNMLKGPAPVISGQPSPTMLALDVQLNDIIREGVDNGLQMLKWDEKEFQLTDPVNLNEAQQKIFDRFSHNVGRPHIDMEAPLDPEWREKYRLMMRPGKTEAGFKITDQFGGGVIPRVWPDESYDVPSPKGMPKVAIYKKRRPNKRRNQNKHR